MVARQRRERGVRAKRTVMGAESWTDVDNFDGFGIEGKERGAELVGAVFVSVDSLVVDRRGEEEENARRERGARGEDWEGKGREGGEGVGEREFAEGWAERGAAAGGEPAEEGGGGRRSREEEGIDVAGGKGEEGSDGGD